MNAAEKIERGCEVNYSSGYTASAGWFHNDVGEKIYGLSLQHGEMPAFDRQQFTTAAELTAAMREIAPLNHWRISQA